MARALLVERSHMARLRHSRGFTLVELAVVVTIVGVLAVLAVVGYRRITLTSKITEAENMVNGIRIAQEQYKSDRGIYLNLGATPCPTGATGGNKAQWDTACNGGNATWASLPVHADGPVLFQYWTVAGPPGAIPSGGFVNTAAANTSNPWYVVIAQADLNNDGVAGLYTTVWTSSFGNQVFKRNEGE